MQHNDAEKLATILLAWSAVKETTRELSEAVEEFLGKYAGKSVVLMDLSAMVGDLLSFFRDNKITF